MAKYILITAFTLCCNAPVFSMDKEKDYEVLEQQYGKPPHKIYRAAWYAANLEIPALKKAGHQNIRMVLLGGQQALLSVTKENDVETYHRMMFDCDGNRLGNYIDVIGQGALPDKK